MNSDANVEPDSNHDLLNFKDLIDLYYKQTSVINSLWAFYAAATFAAAGYSQLSGGFTKSVSVGVAVTIGFLIFAYGHWSMLRGEVDSRWNVCKDIESRMGISQSREIQMRPFLIIVKRTPKIVDAGFVHAGIDFCVIVAIWTRILI